MARMRRFKRVSCWFFVLPGGGGVPSPTFRSKVFERWELGQYLVDLRRVRKSAAMEGWQSPEGKGVERTGDPGMFW